MRKPKRNAYVSVKVTLPLPDESMPLAALGLRLAAAAYTIRSGELAPEFCRGTGADALIALTGALMKKGPRRTATNQVAILADLHFRQTGEEIPIKQAIAWAIQQAGLRQANWHTSERVRKARLRARKLIKTVPRKDATQR